MRAVVKNRQIYRPIAMSHEGLFEGLVKEELNRLLPDFFVVPFKAPIESTEYGTRIPDLAVVSRTLNAWCLVEVELSHHSLTGHVVPQIQCFADGKYTEYHARHIAESIRGAPLDTLTRMITYTRPQIYVIADSHQSIEKGWDEELQAVGASLIIMETFSNEHDDVCLMITGSLPKSLSEVEIFLRKHSYLNALYCLEPPDFLRRHHSGQLSIEYEGSIYNAQIVATDTEAIVFLRPSPHLLSNRKYRLAISSDNRLVLNL
jgi:hypothetical protein